MCSPTSHDMLRATFKDYGLMPNDLVARIHSEWALPPDAASAMVTRFLDGGAATLALAYALIVMTAEIDQSAREGTKH